MTKPLLIPLLALTSTLIVCSEEVIPPTILAKDATSLTRRISKTDVATQTTTNAPLTEKIIDSNDNAITTEYVLAYMRFCASSQFYGKRLWHDGKIIASEDTYYEAATGNDGSKILKFHIDITLTEIDNSGVNAYLSDLIRKQIVTILRTQRPEDGSTVKLDAQTTCMVDACYLDKIRLYCTSTITRKQFLGFIEYLRAQQ